MNILEAIQHLPHVQIILSDNQKTICSVKIVIERQERIDSGSMMFHHMRYITMGQTVVFCNEEIPGDQSGALFFRVDSGENAAEIIHNILEYIPHEKEEPDNSIVMAHKL